MANVEQEREFDVDADQMWKTIGDFANLDSWASGIESIDLSDGNKTRKLNLPGGAVITEHLVESGDRTYTYSLDEGGALPVKNYRSTLSAIERGAGRCKVSWTATFDPADGTPEETAVQIINMVYASGLENIAKAVG
jgi:mxaD protein